MSELNTVETFITTLLLANPDVTDIVGQRVYKIASPGTAYPMVRFSWMGGRDSNGCGATRISSSCVYVVRGIGKGSGSAAIDALAEAIDETLHGAQGDTGDIICCLREAPFQKEDQDGETIFYSRGGLYRIMVH